MTESSPHAGLEVRCSGVITDDEGNPVTKEVDIPDPEMPAAASKHVHQHCDTVLSFEEHGRFVKNPRGEGQHGKALHERFEAAALAFDCPECGVTTYRCPVCSDSDEQTPAGWFRGESTGEQIACPNCNHEEVVRERRNPY